MVPRLPMRPNDGHKGTFGTVCVIGGQADGPTVMLGGPALTAEAALRSGCGLVRLAMPAPILHAGLTIASSATGLALPVNDDGTLQPSKVAAVLDDANDDIDVIAIGPGFGHDEPQQQIVVRLVANEESVPIVVDADALNALAAMPQFDQDLKAPCVLTPHPGEFRRLARPLGIIHDPADPKSRASAAAQLAQRLGCVVVLKGAQTVISDGVQTTMNHSGNVALATAGSGDVLTGVIAGLIAQFHARPGGSSGIDLATLDLFQCACLAVYLHGLAAELWAVDHGCAIHPAGLLARELSDLLPRALAQLERVESP